MVESAIREAAARDGIGHRFIPCLAGMFPHRCVACGHSEDAGVHHASRLQIDRVESLRSTLYEQRLCEVSVIVPPETRAGHPSPMTWRPAVTVGSATSGPCRKPWAPGRMVCAEHAIEQRRRW